MTIVTNWTHYPNFAASEFRCRHTGRDHMDRDFLDLLQQLRTAYGRPMRITSGYRAPEHPIEARKITPGAHATGKAADIGVGPSRDPYDLVRLALKMGFTGIGISQRAGQPRFVHLDTLTGSNRPRIWSY